MGTHTCPLIGHLVELNWSFARWKRFFFRKSIVQCLVKLACVWHWLVCLQLQRGDGNQHEEVSHLQNNRVQGARSKPPSSAVKTYTHYSAAASEHCILKRGYWWTNIEVDLLDDTSWHMYQTWHTNPNASLYGSFSSMSFMTCLMTSP